MKYKMKRNEAKSFLSAQAERYYRGEISWNDYKEIEIEYIPLDFSNFPSIKPEIARWINVLFDEEDHDRSGNYMLRGFTRHEGKEVNLLNMNYGDYSDSINFWAYNDQEYLIYTFCEGDTTLTILPDAETYTREKAETLRWYKEER